MRQTLTDDFWGLHKNMNCALRLKPKKFEKQTNFKAETKNL